jgi:outer membrane protein TolC
MRIATARSLCWTALAFVLAGGASSLAACASYHAAPIDPAKNESALAARSLDDPAFLDWARETMARGTKPVERELPPPSWDLAALSLAAFWFHPDLEVARAEARTAGAGITTASARPNPSFAFRPEYVTNPAPGDSRWVADFGLDVPIELGGKRDARIDRAKKRALAAEISVYEAAWKVRGAVRAAYVDRILSEREVEALRAEAELRRQAAAILRRRMEAGEASRTDLARAEVDLSRVELEHRAAETRAGESRAALAAAIGVPPAALDRVRLDDSGVDRMPAGAIDGAHTAGFLDRFDVRRALLEYDALEADVRLEIARQYPDLSIGPGYVYDQGLHKLAFSFAMPVPLFDRNQGPIAEAESRRGEAQARFLALQARATAEIESALARFRGATAELAEARALAQRQRGNAQATERAFAVGRADRSDVVIAQADAAALARSEITALRDVRSGLGALEDALQRPLDGGTGIPDALPTKGTE